MKKTAIILIFVTFFSKFIGLIREVTLAYFYGVSSISDAYLIAITIPTLLISFIGTGIVTGYIPLYQEIKINRGDNQALELTNNLMNISIVIVTIMLIVAYFFIDEIVFVFASGFEKETFEMAVSFTKISLVSSYFLTIIFILSSYLQTNESYNITSLIGLPLNLIIIYSIIISYKYDIKYLPYGIVFSAFGQVVFLFLFSKIKKYKYRFVFEIKEEYIYKLVKISLPVIVGVIFYQLNILIDRALASRATIGGISALNYSNKIVDFVQGIFVISVTTISYPVLSKHIANKDFKQVKSILKESVVTICLLVIPTSIGSMIFSKEIISFLYGRGAIDSTGLNLISKVFFMYSIGMIAFGLKEAVSKVFYAMQDSKTPMRNAIMGYICNVVLSIILSKYIGIEGIALATSISMMIITILLLISLKQKIGSFGMMEIIKSFVKILTISLFMGITTKLFYYEILNYISSSIALILSILFAILIYILVLCIFKIEDVNVIIHDLVIKMKSIYKF